MVPVLLLAALLSAPAAPLPGLPSGAEIAACRTADLDGDGREELGVLFRASGKGQGRWNLALFRGLKGAWAPWWRPEGDAAADLNAFDFPDANGDGRADLAIYALLRGPPGLGTMRALILGFRGEIGGKPRFERMVSDSVRPPGYPLFGKAPDGAPSVTFLGIGEKGVDGYRRVWCWKDNAFRICDEEVWKCP